MPIPELRTMHTDSSKNVYRSPRRTGRKKKLIKQALLLGAAGALALLIFVAFVVRDLPSVENLTVRVVEESTIIYDRTGEHVLYQFFGDVKRTRLALADIPLSVRHATLVAEDRGFYRHGGFRLRSFVRAAFTNLIKLDPTAQGGSTITQQFVKNAILTTEKTYIRKLKELLLAYRIEKKFTKDQILELYLNEIPYGSTAYGIEAAAETYFDKKTKDLTVAEAALLAALPKAPSYYSPHGSHRDELIERQRYILNGMVDEGYLSREEAEAAKNEDLTFKPPRENIQAPHFVFYIRELLAEKYGDRTLEQGGLKIWSTIDLEKQELAETVVSEIAKTNEKNFKAKNAALVAIDPKTGQILAMVGSRDYFDTDNDGNVNVVTRPRQPGSSFKPVVYAAAFTKGYTPETKLFDVETVFTTEVGDYAPKNYDGKEHGVVSLRQALAGSLNIPSVKVLYLTGIDTVLSLAESMGYTTFGDRSRFGLSLVLGGGEVKLLEHAAAFGAFAREGELLETTGILKIEDSSGKIIEEYKERKKKVVDTNVAREVTNILSDNNERAFIFGATNYLTLPDRPVAAKTGTTNNFIDAWTVGYTPSLVTGVWVGNNDNTPMGARADGSQVAAPIWQRFMREALKGTPIESFTPPSPRTVSNPVLKGELIGTQELELDSVSGKRATEFTPEELKVKKKFFSPHGILFYLDKDNPDGPAPEHPERDPQFTHWEEAITLWANKNGYLAETPPTEYDDVHLPQFTPVVSIVSPLSNETVSAGTLRVFLTAEGVTQTISFVDIFIDGKKVTRLSAFPFETTVTLTDVPNGWHTLSARAFDAVGNRGEAKVVFFLDYERTEVGLSWISPAPQSVHSLSSFPLSINMETPTPELISELSVTAVDVVTGRVVSVGMLEEVSGTGITLEWKKDGIEPSTWRLNALIKDVFGRVVEKNGPTILVNP